MISRPFAFGATPPDWRFPCPPPATAASRANAAGMEERPLLVRRRGSALDTDGVLWCRPVHNLHSGTVSGADLVTRPDYLNGTAEPGGQAARLLHEAGHRASLCETPLTLCLTMPSGLAYDAGLVRHAEAALRAWAPKTCSIELVLNEAGVAQAGPGILLALSALRDFGVGLALECGRDMPASLARMQRLPLTCLRLPAGLVGDVPHSGPARLAVSQAVRTALVLDLTVMAQSVQTAAQRDILADLGCDTAQGTLFGHPMPTAAFQAALAGEHT